MKTKEEIQKKFDELVVKVEAIADQETRTMDQLKEWREINAQMALINWVLYGF